MVKSDDPVYRVIRPDGVRSKPTSAERIIEMYRLGKISEESVIRQEGSDLEIPVGVFVDLHSVGAPPSTPKKRTTFVPVEPGHLETFESSEPEQITSRKPPSLARRPWWRHDDEHLDLIGGLWHFLSFSGMKTPRGDRKKTGTYLSNQINWLERYVKVLHFFNVVYVWLMLLGILNAVFQNRAFLIDLFQQAGLWGGLRILAASSYLALIYGIVLMLSFLILMTAEALLRLVPATLRYWMAISEDTSPPTT
jgi:hypothetical protein